MYNFDCEFVSFYVHRAAVLKRTRGCADVSDAEWLRWRRLRGPAWDVSVRTAHDVARAQLSRDAQQWPHAARIAFAL